MQTPIADHDSPDRSNKREMRDLTDQALLSKMFRGEEPGLLMATVEMMASVFSKTNCTKLYHPENVSSVLGEHVVSRKSHMLAALR